MTIKVSKIIVAILFSLYLSGCATITDSKIINGRKVYNIDCSGKIVSIDVCYKKAKKLCPNSYTVINHKAKTPADNLPSIPANYSALKASEEIAYSMPGVAKGITIMCR